MVRNKFDNICCRNVSEWQNEVAENGCTQIKYLQTVKKQLDIHNKLRSVTKNKVTFTSDGM